MTTKERLHQLVDQLPESEVFTATRVLEALRAMAHPLAAAPEDDEPTTDDDLAAMAEGWAQYRGASPPQAGDGTMIMAEHQYGTKKTLYGVVQSGDRVELRVYTDNNEVRAVLGRYASEPEGLLGRQATWVGSSIRAKSEFAKVMHDYRSYFAGRRLKIIFQ